MPCMCWYDPGEEPKKEIKLHCEKIVEIIKQLELIGDPLGVSLNDAQKLLEHLYTGKCEEKEKQNV